MSGGGINLNRAVRSITPDHVDAFAATSTLAFAVDPVVRYMLPRSERYFEFFPPMVRVGTRLGLEHGTAQQTEACGGVALWLPPGVKADSSVTMELMQRSIDPERLPEVLASFAPADAYYPKGPCWYLQMIAVDPAQQGRGLGSALLAAMLKRIDEEHALSYLLCSNPKSRPLYERHGFTALAEVSVTEGVHLVPMLRPAR